MYVIQTRYLQNQVGCSFMLVFAKLFLIRACQQHNNRGLSTAGHHVATGDRGYSSQFYQRSAQLHLPFPFRYGNSVSVIAHDPCLAAAARSFTPAELVTTCPSQRIGHCQRVVRDLHVPPALLVHYLPTSPQVHLGRWETATRVFLSNRFSIVSVFIEV